MICVRFRSTRQKAEARASGWSTAPRRSTTEEFKAEDNPLNVRDRIINVYAKEGFDSIPTDDLHGRAA